MIKRLIINDIKEHKVISIATGIFMTVTAMLFGLSILLFTSLFTSIDDLMTRAGAPDFLQMHTGDISRVVVNCSQILYLCRLKQLCHLVWRCGNVL